jgi:hypothetical protein
MPNTLDPKELAERALKGELKDQEAAELIAYLLDLYPPGNPPQRQPQQTH